MAVFDPDRITKQNVIDAIKEIDENELSLRPSTGYDVVYKGKKYPPKDLMRLAHEKATGEYNWVPGGGEATNKYLRQLGFEIIEKSMNKVNMDESKIKRFKELYSQFKLTEDYEVRLNQLPITPVFREIILETLNNEPITNDHLTGLIQMFKYGCSDESFDKYLGQNIPNEKRSRVLLEKVIEINQFGYTGAGRMTITNLDQKQLNIIKKFLKDSFNIESVTEAVTLCEKFEANNIPLVKTGIYSPWLYYINPGLFPIINNTHKTFLKWMEISAEYPNCIAAFNKLKDLVGETNLGLLDYFAYKFIGDIKTLNLSGARFFKMSHGVFKKKTEFKNTGIAELLEKKHLISLNSYTGKGQGDSFINDAKIGDFVYVCYGGDNMYCVGKIISDSVPLDAEADKLINGEGEWVCREIDPLFFPIESSVDEFKDEREFFMPSGNSTFYEVPKNQLDYLNEKIFLPKWNLQIIDDSNIAKHVNSYNSITMHNLNTILYGPPGTGKTYQSIMYAVAIVEDWTSKELEDSLTGKFPDNRTRDDLKEKFNLYIKRGGMIEFVTFHQNYTYEDFVKGLKPDTKAGSLIFKRKQGVFYKLCIRAKESYERHIEDGYPIDNYVLIIDEINRANISRVFGELITLIEPDKRNGGANAIEVSLPSGERFSVPPNLYIIGTMNTADKSIALVDIALRRRFDFIPMYPQPDLIEDEELKDIFIKLNDAIYEAKRESADFLIGHSYFMGKKIADLKTIMENRVIPLLNEYFMNDSKKVIKILDASGIKCEMDKKTYQIKYIG